MSSHIPEFGVRIHRPSARQFRAPASLAQCFARNNSLRAIVALCLLVECGPLVQAQGNSIHVYADAAACQMGAREGHYLPFGIRPDATNDLIPMFWDQYGLIWKRDPLNNGQGEFLLTGPPPASGGKDCSKIPCEIGMDFPEPGANGPFKDPYDSGLTRARHLRCDHFPYVEASCTPGQLVKELFQGTCGRGPDAKSCQASAMGGLKCADGSACVDIVRWRVLFRRAAASAKDGCTMAEFKPECTEYYPTVDADGLRISDRKTTVGPNTYGVTWLDSVGCSAAGCGSGARDFTNGFRNNQPVPRPGGKRPALRPEGLRASTWYDDTKLISSQPVNACNNCHGTPFNGNDWILQKGGGIPDGRPPDDVLPWWFAGNDDPILAPLFPVKNIFDNNAPVSCSGCHRRWMEGAGSTPGGLNEQATPFPFVRWMMMVHEAIGADLDENPFEVIDPVGLQELASSFRIDKPTKIYVNKKAKQTHYMPPDHTKETIAAWDAAYRTDYNNVACCGAGFGKATGRAGQDCFAPGKGMPECPLDVQLPPGTDKLACSAIRCDTDMNPLLNQKQIVSLFQTPWMFDAKVLPNNLADKNRPNPTQTIAAPDPPEAGTVMQITVDCPAGIGAGPGDKCFKLTWNDPSKGEEFNAPQTFHYKQQDDMLGPNLKPVKLDYCTDASKEPDSSGDPDEFSIPDGGADKPFFPVVNQSPIRATCDPTKDLDCWRYTYQTIGISKKCTRKTLHICGGWCSQAIKLDDKPARRIVSTEKGQVLNIENTNGLPKGKLNLGDGMENFHFNGTGTNLITVLVPAQFCNGGGCTLAHGDANGTQDLQSSGAYTVSSPSNAPFSLTANQDGSFTVNQTAQIQLDYTSTAGNLIGMVQISTVEGGQGFATMEGTFNASGGSFAQFFPAGGTVYITLGLTGSLQGLVDHHGFLAAEFQSGAVEPVAACIKDNSSDLNFAGVNLNLPRPADGHNVEREAQAFSSARP